MDSLLVDRDIINMMVRDARRDMDALHVWIR